MRKLTLTLAVASLASCSASDDLSGADSAIKIFHERLNGEQFGAIYAQSDTAFKTATPESESLKFLSAVHAKLGNFRTSKRKNWRVNYGTGAGTIVELESQFERGKATELFTFRNGSDPRLVGYNINSTAFITQ